MQRPDWMKIRYIDTPNTDAVEKILKNLNLNTVCREANCPNYMECFSKKTATFMILGTDCTRDCRFCNVTHAIPVEPDADEPRNVALAVKELGLQYVVVTSVTRDDLPDGGAEHFAKTIRAIREISPNTAIEVLIPDFQGNLNALACVIYAQPCVISHNMETVKSLYAEVRPQAAYERSLKVIENIKKLDANINSKSGIMVGLGETKEQIYELFDDLRSVGCEFLTVGQYLAPSKLHVPIKEYIEPSVFDEYKEIAIAKGFAFVASAPFVRSSYHAGEALGR